MSWQNELEELRTREAFAEELGGAMLEQLTDLFKVD